MRHAFQTMKRALASIVLLLFTLYVQSVPAYWVLYALFADRIAIVYCVNPGNPACHGRCHIVATTQKQERQDAPASEIRLEKPQVFIIDAPSPEAVAGSEGTYRGSPLAELAEGVRPGIEHPPPVSI
jgi:hypothetical protein